MTSSSLPCAALVALVALSTGCLGTHAADPAPVIRGPLAIRTQHPVSLTFLHMRPRRAKVLDEGAWAGAVDLAYSSIFEIETAPGEGVFFDGETARAAARVRYGVAPKTDLEVEVSALFASSGFMDSFIDGFHESFHLPDAGRDEAERDQFDMRLRRNGQLIYELEEDRIGIGELPVVVTRQIREEDGGGPAVALRVGVEFPTGSEERGYGNGEIDAGGGVLLERTMGRWTVSGAADLIFLGQPDAWADAGVDTEDMVQLQAGAEYRWSDRLSLLGQLFLTSPMTRDYSVEEFDAEILSLGLGCAYDLKGGGQLYSAFTEDLVAATGPDFAVFLGVSWGF